MPAQLSGCRLGSKMRFEFIDDTAVVFGLGSMWLFVHAGGVESVASCPLAMPIAPRCHDLVLADWSFLSMVVVLFGHCVSVGFVSVLVVVCRWCGEVGA